MSIPFLGPEDDVDEISDDEDSASECEVRERHRRNDRQIGRPRRKERRETEDRRASSVNRSQ